MIQNRASKPKYQIVQRPDRLWEVRRQGEQISLHGSELQAVDFAVRLASAGQRIVVKSRYDNEPVASLT